MNLLLAAHDHKEAERCMRLYRAHFHYDHWKPKRYLGIRNGADCFEYIEDAPRSLLSEDALLNAAMWILDYNYKIVILHANTDHPKVSMRRY
jgi:hypothetical protein